MIRDGALHRLADPPGRIRRELEAAAPVELLDRAVQPERALLDQVEERDAEAAVALRDRDDEAEVRLDHAALRARVAALDRLREHDLVGGGQQLVLADVGEEELQAVGRAAGRRCGLGGGELRLLLLFLLGLGGGRGGRRRDLEPDALELGRQLLDVLVVQVELERERLELGRLEVAALLRASRPWRAPDRSRATRAVDSASGSTQSFRSCLEDRHKALLTLGVKSSACQGKRASHLRVFRSARNVGLGARAASPDPTQSTTRGGRGKLEPQDVRLRDVAFFASSAPGRGRGGRRGARSPGRA